MGLLVEAAAFHAKHYERLFQWCRLYADTLLTLVACPLCASGDAAEV
jgi:hypothetical protein